MAQLIFEISVSVDGYVAGPDPTLEEPLGRGGEQLHEWVTRLRSWRETHGREGGETGVDDDLIRASTERPGAIIMGKRMFCGADGPWGDEPFEGWWGDEPPFHMPVFVLTHHPREDLVKEGGTTFHFVTEGIEAALERATEAADGRDVAIAGGADVARQYLAAGHLDEVTLHVVPLLLGGGTRLFGAADGPPPELELTRVIDSPGVTHMSYEVRGAGPDGG